MQEHLKNWFPPLSDKLLMGIAKRAKKKKKGKEVHTVVEMMKDKWMSALDKKLEEKKKEPKEEKEDKDEEEEKKKKKEDDDAMVGTNLRALFDFDGNTLEGELTLEQGEILKLISKPDEGGVFYLYATFFAFSGCLLVRFFLDWWEGRRQTGEIGYFPAPYVELYTKKTEGLFFNKIRAPVEDSSEEEKERPKGPSKRQLHNIAAAAKRKAQLEQQAKKDAEAAKEGGGSNPNSSRKPSSARSPRTSARVVPVRQTSQGDLAVIQIDLKEDLKKKE